VTRPTHWALLLSLAVVSGVVAYLITKTSYSGLPHPRLIALLWIAFLAIAECYLAVLTRARLAGRSGTKPINPLAVARYVALAKASSLVGAVLVGGYAGYLTWTARQSFPEASTNTRTAAFGVGFSLLLVAAALFLERVCRVPEPPGDDE
jgi:Protein of unknown function (DUF3180)